MIDRLALMTMIRGLFFLLSLSMGSAHSEPAPWVSGEFTSPVLHVELFLSSTCPHCHAADVFFSDLEKKEPWVVVHRYVVNENKAALQQFYERLHAEKSEDFSVPAFFFCDSHWVGFANAATTGTLLLKGLTYCRDHLMTEKKLSPSTVNVLRQWGVAGQFQQERYEAYTPYRFMLVTAWTDALSPCSFFCLAAFLAFLWLYPVSRWSGVGLGMVGLFSIGAIHFMQQVYVRLIPGVNVYTALVGVCLLLVMVRFRKQALDARPHLFMFILAGFVFSTVEFHQQTCVFQPALLFHQWLVAHAVSPAMQWLYELSYQVIYLLPLAALLFVYWVFGQHSRLLLQAEKTRNAACCMLFFMGVIMIIHPAWLASVAMSLLVVFGSILIAYRRNIVKVLS